MHAHLERGDDAKAFGTEVFLRRAREPGARPRGSRPAPPPSFASFISFIVVVARPIVRHRSLPLPSAAAISHRSTRAR
eukprot:2956-Pelagococcus_subviridis.AAC.1